MFYKYYYYFGFGWQNWTDFLKAFVRFRMYPVLYASRLSTTPTLIVCLPYKHEAWYDMQSLARLGQHDG